jgi:hypothetical protein
MRIVSTAAPARSLPRHLTRYRMVMLIAVSALGCDSATEPEPEPGSITISLTPVNATVQQGASTQIIVTLTRNDTFTGPVNLTVSGAPNGVVANVSTFITSGAVTTATVAINVPATTAPGVYTLNVKGTGSGVPDATATFSLTVTETPAFTLTLSASALSIARGASTPTTTINLGRTNFDGGVTLNVVLDDPNHCECLPAGITAAFSPNPATGASSVLTISVASTVAVGTYSLVVSGSAAGVAGRFAFLTLTVT